MSGALTEPVSENQLKPLTKPLSENEVKPLKKMLGKYGISTGDGSIGNKNIGANAFGITTLTRAPTTRMFGNYYASTGYKKYW